MLHWFLMTEIFNPVFKLMIARFSTAKRRVKPRDIAAKATVTSWILIICTRARRFLPRALATTESSADDFGLKDMSRSTMQLKGRAPFTLKIQVTSTLKSIFTIRTYLRAGLIWRLRHWRESHQMYRKYKENKSLANNKEKRTSTRSRALFIFI